ncbi:hypothetical protein [Actinomadura rayongensis]|uniref:DUF3040 domain-containing protein n=1 Tax=Actinomadura rayongensis TaxID=1429076 RepID=A0A6I4WIN2_9ACTN|nr:hypothetical protein [Actinomadura rayongensis]MXQ67586.1 hypothetical protein [Actinomadura rayongensis]
MTTARLPHDELAAAMAARRELGPDYDAAFAQAIADRVEELVAARRAPARLLDSGFVLAVLSLAAAIPLSAIAAVQAGLAGLAVVWTGVVLFNAVHARRP